MKKLTVYFSLLLLIVLHLSCSNRPVLTENINTEKEWNKVDSILKLISEPVIPEEEYYLNDFGGKGDGIFDNKAAFDSVISVTANNGGGKIIVPPGIYFIKGPIHLKSNINLHLQEGSKLTFSIEPTDYLPIVLTSW